MKKLLLIIVTLSFISTGIAQVKQYAPRNWYKTVKDVKPVKVAEQEATYTVPVNPTVTNSRAADIIVGETWYDLQSNSSIPFNRICAFEDGTLAATWTRGMEPANYPDRGTGYNYHDGTDWGAYPEERVEAQRTGWPSIAPFGENGEITCAHSGGDDGLIFSWRENKGEGDWNYFNLVGPAPNEDILWPRMVTSGENNEIVHVICVTPGEANGGTIYEGLDGALLYSRTSDGGQTWDYENVILDGVSSSFTNTWGGDDYGWAQPVGNTIAFVAFGGIRDGVLMKSTDAGDNWDRIVFYESPSPFFENGDLIPAFGGGDGYNTCVIDDEEIVHVAFGRQIHADDDGGGPYYYPYSDGLVYWNETMPALDSARLQADILPADWTTMNLYQNGQLAAWTQENGEDTIVGVAPYYASLTGMPQLAAYRDEFGKKIVQVFYSALSVGFSNPGTETNYRHIWGRFTEGDGMWSEFIDYNDDILHMFNECAYPSLAQTMTNNTFHILYQTDMVPGNSLQPSTGPSHDPALNSMVYLPVSPLPVDVDVTDEQTFNVSQSYPNPTSGTASIEITLSNAANVSLDVMNVAGQIVKRIDNQYTTVGRHILSIDASDLTSGVYFYTVNVGEKSVTNKFIVE